jgi:hypothetical protein
MIETLSLVGRAPFRLLALGLLAAMGRLLHEEGAVSP